MNTIYTEETKGYYQAALTYWRAVLDYGAESALARDEADVVSAFARDAVDRGATRAELHLLNVMAKVNVSHDC